MVQVGFHQLAIYPAHNFDIPLPQLKLFEESIKKDIGLSKDNPTSYLVVLLGDFNLERLDSHRISIPNPTSPGDSGDLSPEGIMPVDARAKRWHKIFDDLIEVCSPAPTHFYSSQLFLNQIDRIFISAPRSAMCLFNEKGGVTKNPVDLYTRGLSDHAPVFWSVSQGNSTPHSSQRLLPEWCESPVFLQRCECLFEAAELPSLSLPDQSAFIKLISRDASMHARDSLFESDPHSNHAMTLRFF